MSIFLPLIICEQPFDSEGGQEAQTPIHANKKENKLKNSSLKDRQIKK